MEGFIEYLQNNEIKNVIILSGAGVSTNAGIPDYRSDTGIFKGKPEDVFTKDNTDVMSKLKGLMSGAKPTTSHYLGKILYEKGLLRRIYTQNIDGLYQKAGVPTNKIVEFHGSLNDVIYYGDSIKDETVQKVSDEIDSIGDVDCLLVMGTSLQVAPFCALPNMVRKECCRVLIDMNPSYRNNFSKQKRNYDGFYQMSSSCSYAKFGKHKATLRPQWRGKKYKTEFIIKDDVDKVSTEIMKHIS